jgi:hypothetical protein
VIHEPDLLDRLDALPKEAFEGDAFRATRLSLDPLAASYNAGRWMSRDTAAVLYTSLARDGALAEIVFHWSQLNPRPTKPVVVHRMRVVAHRTLRLIRADLTALGIAEDAYKGMNPARTQEIGAAVEFLGCDGLIAPSARWTCDNLMLFPERMRDDATLEIVHSETVDWLAWGKDSGMID